MSKLDLETLLADFDARARAAQERLEQQRLALTQFHDLARTTLREALEAVAARLERSGHEAEVTIGTDAISTGTTAEADIAHYVQLRLAPRAFPGHRASRPPDKHPLVRFQLDLDDQVVRVWARDVSLDGKDVEVGFRNDLDGLPLGYPLEAVTAALVAHHALVTVAFALRESAQTAMF